MARRPIVTNLIAAMGMMLTLNRSGGEIFTNPFLLREALLTEGEIVKMITEFNIDRNTTLGKAIDEYVRLVGLEEQSNGGQDNCRFSEEHGRVAKLLSKPLEEYPLSAANEDEPLHDIASNPIHAFKLIYRLRKVFMGKVLSMIRTKWPKGTKTIFYRSMLWQHRLSSCR